MNLSEWLTQEPACASHSFRVSKLEGGKPAESPEDQSQKARLHRTPIRWSLFKATVSAQLPARSVLSGCRTTQNAVTTLPDISRQKSAESPESRTRRFNKSQGEGPWSHQLQDRLGVSGYRRSHHALTTRSGSRGREGRKQPSHRNVNFKKARPHPMSKMEPLQSGRKPPNSRQLRI
jgi:hypothetical protein